MEICKALCENHTLTYIDVKNCLFCENFEHLKELKEDQRPPWIDLLSENFSITTFVTEVNLPNFFPQQITDQNHPNQVR